MLLAVSVVAGCMTVPPTNVHQPMTARPAPRFEASAGNGAIYQAGTGRPLFEDRRARYVGDTITVNITESTTASAKSNNKVDKSNNQQASVSALSGLPGKGLLGLNLGATSSTAFSGKGEAANNNVFTGNITVTVIDVMPNGNLLVSGEKQLAIGQRARVCAYFRRDQPKLCRCLQYDCFVESCRRPDRVQIGRTNQ
jgi:flagellar L-ring protein precursor FlgH